jgi:hypothetical protein
MSQKVALTGPGTPCLDLGYPASRVVRNRPGSGTLLRQPRETKHGLHPELLHLD